MPAIRPHCGNTPRDALSGARNCLKTWTRWPFTDRKRPVWRRRAPGTVTCRCCWHWAPRSPRSRPRIAACWRRPSFPMAVARWPCSTGPKPRWWAMSDSRRRCCAPTSSDASPSFPIASTRPTSSTRGAWPRNGPWIGHLWPPAGCPNAMPPKAPRPSSAPRTADPTDCLRQFCAGVANRYGSYVLKPLHDLTGNWVWASILTVLIIKLLLYPLPAKQYQSFAKMRAIQPRIEALKIAVWA
ncbi:MAG: hypothetical protein DCF27_06070 [Lysobacteraceae bacterium]|nr:MAG: hypothetical protein DCF27_06070 [Xanthomonadaceae bacterium]